MLKVLMAGIYQIIVTLNNVRQFVEQCANFNVPALLQWWNCKLLALSLLKMFQWDFLTLNYNEQAFTGMFIWNKLLFNVLFIF